MSVFPFFKELEGTKGLIVGGGRVALRKTERMLSYGPELTIVAPDIVPEIQEMNVAIKERAFLASDITPDLEFVIAASDSEEVNRQVYLLCQQMGIPVNVVDEPEYCTFLFPALVKRGKLSVGISTSGASPSAAVWLRKEIEKILPDHVEQMLDWLQEQRSAVKKQIEDEEERSHYLKQLFIRCLENQGLQDEKSTGRVSLVGAGCGSKEWITVEGLCLLRTCDAVVYDDLIDMTLLDEAPSYAEKIYVGKRSHRSSAEQEDIQSILVALAGQNKHVVRLKGGDPFVFGRGGEEIEALNRYQIPWNVVPGVSSALAIPAEAGIPVTYRGVSRSIHIVTAHTREHALRRDMEQFAYLEGTLVILMGLESLEEIVTILREKGRDRSTPVAILSGGNTARPYRVTGTLETIVEMAEKEKVTTPGIIVIGSVAAFDLHNGAKCPLLDVSVGLTGTDEFQAKLRGKLLPLGARPVSMMQGRCEEVSVRIPWEQITDSGNKWIIFTSVQGIRYFFRRCREEKIDTRGFAFCKFAVIGAATKAALEEFGFTADVCPKKYTSLNLAEELLVQRKEDERLYLFCSKQGTDLLTERLARQGIECQRFDIYSTHFICRKEESENPEYVLFGSAGGVRELYQSGYRMTEGMTGVCIGPICAEAYRECFESEPVTAKTATVAALVEALTDTAADMSM